MSEQTGKEKRGRLLAVSFGTSQRDARENAIGSVEQALERAFGEDWEVRRCFTSKMVIRHILREEKIRIDDPAEALERALAEGIRELVVQPTHVMNGREYDKLMEQVERYRDRFDRVAAGEPLFSSEDDLDAVIFALRRVTKEYDDGHTGIVLVGHGTDHEANRVYGRLQEKFAQFGYEHYLLGTIEAAPGLKDVQSEAEQRGYSRIVLIPLMIVAGEHAVCDIAGDQPDSWKSVFRQAGYQAEVLSKGLGEYEDIQRLFVRHARQAMAKEGMDR